MQYVNAINNEFQSPGRDGYTRRHVMLFSGVIRSMGEDFLRDECKCVGLDLRGVYGLQDNWFYLVCFSVYMSRLHAKVL
jgi:hypothetical protein